MNASQKSADLSLQTTSIESIERKLFYISLTGLVFMTSAFIFVVSL